VTRSESDVALSRSNPTERSFPRNEALDSHPSSHPLPIPMALDSPGSKWAPGFSCQSTSLTRKRWMC